MTHALLAGSPAINAGDNAVCAVAPVNNVDQRGHARNEGASCDIGAYEFAVVVVPPPVEVPLPTPTPTLEGVVSSSGLSLVRVGEVPLPLEVVRDLLIEAGCQPVSIWLTVDGQFAGYIFGAPDAVNERFPLELLPAAAFLVRCEG